MGRAAVRQLALGDSHTLFLDRLGGLWACGENKEGQCGLGTPLEVIASQHRRAYYDTFRALRGTVTAVSGRWPRGGSDGDGGERQVAPRCEGRCRR